MNHLILVGCAIRSLKGVTKPANTVLTDGARDVRLACPSAGFLIGHKIEPEHPIDSSEGNAEVKALMRGPRSGVV